MRKTALLVLLVACGDSTPPPKAAQPIDVVATDAGAPPAPPPGRGPSDALLAHWPALETHTLVYVDGAAFGGSDVVRGITGAVPLPAGVKACIDAGFAGVKEVLAASTDAEPFVALRVEGDALAPACTPLLDGWKPATIAGATTALADPRGGVVAFAPGFAFAGARARVEAALAGTPRADVGIRLAPGEVVAVRGDADHHVTYTGSLLLDRERLRLAADVKVDDERVANALDQQLGNVSAAPDALAQELRTDAEGKALLAKLAAAFSHTRTGPKAQHVQLELVEAPADQAKDIAGVARLAQEAVRAYLVNAKAAEARNSVRQIAKDLVAWYESEELGPKGQILPQSKKRLFSIAPTPKTVPRGTKYQSAPADWKPWAKLRFELTSPQHYQYEVKAAKDGKSAEILAHGDLNGDGKTSTFALRVEIRPDRMWIEPQLRETAPEE